ncbi:MAG TPA: TerB family tellurite resistance protein [Polyangiaceae bacterium]|nr:TerB family tellurite resistance protein [Polyangiaceae bacterium]
MFRLSPEKIRALSERLRDRGAPDSMVRTPGAGDPETEMLLFEYGPLCEVMFLAMSADGEVAQAERDVLRGALRELDDRIRTSHFGAMLKQAEENLGKHGQRTRLAAVAKDLAPDPIRGEVAYVLASAVVYADDDMSMTESAFLNDLADALGIDDARSEQLQRLLL